MATSFTVEIDWAASGSWTDETSRVIRVQTRAGFARPGDAVASVGRAELTLDNSDGRFSPGNTSSPLYGDLLPRRAVRIKASDGTTTWTLWRGYIERIQPAAGEHGAQRCMIACVDGLALLEQQRVGVAHEDSKPVDDAVAVVVSAAYTPPATDYADNGDDLADYGRSWQPERTSARAALREIAEAVYGRFWISRDGTATYWSRDERQDASVVPALVLGPYHDRVLSMHAANLFAYWRLNEASGSSAADASGNGHTGTVTGVTWGQAGIGDGLTAGGFDGINDDVDVHSAGLASAFNGAAGTLLLWFRVADAGVWTDGSWRRLLSFRVDANNSLEVYRRSSDNDLSVTLVSGGTTRTLTYHFASAPTGWQCVATTWSEADDKLSLYINGESQTPISYLGTWAGSLVTAHLGSRWDDAYYWHGDLAHVALWDCALTADEIACLGRV